MGEECTMKGMSLIHGRPITKVELLGTPSNPSAPSNQGVTMESDNYQLNGAAVAERGDIRPPVNASRYSGDFAGFLADKRKKPPEGPA